MSVNTCTNCSFTYHLCWRPAFIWNPLPSHDYFDQSFPLFITTILTPPCTHGSPYKHSPGGFNPALFNWYLNNILSFTQISPVAFVVLERMSITEVIPTLFQENSFHKPNLSHDGAKKALEGTAWADVCSPE